MALVDGAYALFFNSQRTIGGIIPDVTIEEIGTDVLRVTDHPVEVGATISDHAFKMPCEIIMRCGWSNSTAGYDGAAQDAYIALLQLQARREPFTISTGKRLYQNMLITLLNQVTDATSENALLATIGCREVILTYTQAGEAMASAQSLAPQTSSPSSFGFGQLSTNPSLPAFAQINPAGVAPAAVTG